MCDSGASSHEDPRSAGGKRQRDSDDDEDCLIGSLQRAAKRMSIVSPTMSPIVSPLPLITVENHHIQGTHKYMAHAEEYAQALEGTYARQRATLDATIAKKSGLERLARQWYFCPETRPPDESMRGQLYAAIRQMYEECETQNAEMMRLLEELGQIRAYPGRKISMNENV